MSKRKRIVSFIVALVFLFSYAVTADASSFTSTYTTNEIFAEKPEEVFKTPECLFEGEGQIEGVEVWAEKSLSVKLPMDGYVARELLLVNNTERNLCFRGTDDFKLYGDIAQYTEGQLCIFHPNPMNIYLAPNETRRIVLTVDFGNHLSQLKDDITGILTVEEFFIVETMNTSPDETIRENFSVKVDTEISAYAYTSSAVVGAQARTATVCGYVTDEDGNPVQGAKIVVQGNIADYDDDTKTDVTGYFSVKVYPEYNEFYEKWHPYRVVVGKENYTDASALVRPEKDKTTQISLKIKKRTQSYEYSKVKEIETGIQGYWSDYSLNGEMIATVPFHSAYSRDIIEKNSYLTITNQMGNKVHKIAMNAETPWVNVSDDGKYVVTQFGYYEDDSEYTAVKVIDADGNTVYERKYLPKLDMTTGSVGNSEMFFSRCSAISNDGNTVWIGTGDGEFYSIDRKTDTILWTALIHNQIRTINESADGKKVYITSGDGFITCYDMEGVLLWKTYIGSWGTGIDVGEKYVVVSSKCASNSLRVLDAESGEQMWCFDTPGRGYVKLSHDESMVYYGNDTSAAYSAASGIVFETKTGNVKYVTDRGSMNGAWSGDDNYFAVKTSEDLYVHDGHDGTLLWTEHVVNSGGGATTLYLSNDAKYIVAGFNTHESYGKLCFYELTKISPIEDQIICSGGHNWDAGKVTKAATYDATGKKIYTCRDCGATKEEVIAKLPKTSLKSKSITIAAIKDVTYTGKAITPAPVVKDGKTTLKKGTHYTVTYKNNVKVGTATVTITGKGKYSGTVNVTFKIRPVSISTATVTGISSKVYTGKAITQKPVVKIGKTTLKPGTDYTISYTNNKNVGTAKMVITGKGVYSKTITRTFKINPKPTTIKTLKAGKKLVKATWNKITAQVGGYQIQYSLNKNFKTGNKTVNIKKNTITGTTIKNLTGGKKYFVRIRTYKKVGSRNFFSAWSAIKYTTVKK